MKYASYDNAATYDASTANASRISVEVRSRHYYTRGVGGDNISMTSFRKSRLGDSRNDSMSAYDEDVSATPHLHHYRKCAAEYHASDNGDACKLIIDVKKGAQQQPQRCLSYVKIEDPLFGKNGMKYIINPPRCPNPKSSTFIDYRRDNQGRLVASCISDPNSSSDAVFIRYSNCWKRFKK